MGFIAGIISHLVFGMLMGAIFVYLIKKTSSTHLYLKGIGMGITIWFFSFSIATLYNIPLFKDIPPTPALTTFAGSVIWGFVTAFSLKVLEKSSDLV
jgi:uncharacterized membrane protein YagU involved in acid resistance